MNRLKKEDFEFERRERTPAAHRYSYRKSINGVEEMYEIFTTDGKGYYVYLKREADTWSSWVIFDGTVAPTFLKGLKFVNEYLTRLENFRKMKAGLLEARKKYGQMI